MVEIVRYLFILPGNNSLEKFFGLSKTKMQGNYNPNIVEFMKNTHHRVILSKD